MQYLLGVDIGTSGTKTVLFDTKGVVIAAVTREYPLYTPQNGWAEQNPQDWWLACRDGIAMVMKTAKIDPTAVAGIGLSGQMHGLVMLDENGAVLRPSILWCDQRTEKQCVEIGRLVGAQRHIEIAANPPLTGFTAGKILWVRENEPEIYEKCRHILLPKDYVRYQLTGVFATEVSDASGMGLLHVTKRAWSEEILEKLSINPDLLPKVYESPEITGYIAAEVAAQTGLAVGTPVVGGAGDNAAAAVGTGVVCDGTAFTTIGSSGVVYAHSSKIAIDPKGRVHTFCAAVPNQWHVMGVTLAAGLSLKWFAENFCGEELEKAKREGCDVYDLLTQMAATVPAGCDGLVYLPYLNGERTPHLDPNARGVFFGLSSMHKKAHLIRAVLEGVSYSLLDCMEILREMGVETQQMLACGGGGKSVFWRSMLADLFGCDLSTITGGEGPALGVAILAGVGTGVFESVEAGCEALIHTEKAQNPDTRQPYEKSYALYKRLYQSLKDCF